MKYLIVYSYTLMEKLLYGNIMSNDFNYNKIISDISKQEHYYVKNIAIINIIKLGDL